MLTTHPTRQAHENAPVGARSGCLYADAPGASGRATSDCGRLTRLCGRLSPVKVLSAVLALCPFAEVSRVFRVTLFEG